MEREEERRGRGQERARVREPNLLCETRQTKSESERVYARAIPHALTRSRHSGALRRSMTLGETPQRFTPNQPCDQGPHVGYCLHVRSQCSASVCRVTMVAQRPSLTFLVL